MTSDKRTKARTPRSLSDPRHRGFSCPHVPLDWKLVETLTTGHFGRVTVSFLARFGEILERRSHGIAPLLDAWLDGPIDFDTVWDPSFGKIRELLVPPPSDEDTDPHEEYRLEPPRGDADDIVERGTEVALRLLERGTAGQFRAEFGRPTRLRWDRWVLPIADTLDVSSNGRRASVVTSLQGVKIRVSLERSSGGWIADRATALAVVDLGAGPVVVMPPDREECLSQKHGHLPIPAGELTSAIGQIESAAALTARYAPVYGPWVRRVARFVLPVTALAPRNLASGSFLHRPGVIFIASPMPVAVVAELLAHEASHQHFWLAAQAGAVDDRSDTRWRHFSPYVRKQRSLRMMLMTYHAFANAVLFHRNCQVNGLFDPHGRDREQEFSALFEQYEGLLRESALTPLGNMMWQTVAAEVHARPRVDASTPPVALAQP